MGIRINKVMGYGTQDVIPDIDWEWLWEQTGEDFLEFLEKNKEKVLDFFLNLTEDKNTITPKLSIEMMSIFRKNLNDPSEYFFHENEYENIFIVQPYWEYNSWRRYDDMIDYHEEKVTNPELSTRIYKIKDGIYPYDKKVLLEKDDNLPDHYLESSYVSKKGLTEEDKKKYRNYIPIEAISLLNFCGIWDKSFINSLEPLLCILWK